MRSPSASASGVTLPLRAAPGLLIASGMRHPASPGCKTFSPDGGMGPVAAIIGQGLNKDVIAVRTVEDDIWARETVDQLLKKPLTADAAVQVALLNNRGLQAAYNELGIAEAVMVASSRPPAPSFSISNVSTSLELDIERQIVASILALATQPARSRIAADRFAQAQLQAALETLRVAAETRRAYYRAVAAREIVAALTGFKSTAETSAELAKQLGETGALNKLDQARQQVFYADVATELAAAHQQATIESERLVRLMGLWSDDTDFKLPGALPKIPGKPQTLPNIEQDAMDRRVDLQIARIEVEALAKSYGLTRETRFINVLDAAGISKTQKDKNSGEPHSGGGGFDVAFQVPIFDFGRPRVTEAEQQYMQAVNLLAEAAVNARSEAREPTGLTGRPTRLPAIISARCCPCGGQPSSRRSSIQLDAHRCFRARHRIPAADHRHRQRHRSQTRFLDRLYRSQRGSARRRRHR